MYPDRSEVNTRTHPAVTSWNTLEVSLPNDLTTNRDPIKVSFALSAVGNPQRVKGYRFISYWIASDALAMTRTGSFAHGSQ